MADSHGQFSSRGQYDILVSEHFRSYQRPIVRGDGPCRLLYQVLTNGFEKYHALLGKSGNRKELQERLRFEFQVIGTIVTLVKGIIMNFASRLHDYQAFFPNVGDGHFGWEYLLYAALNVGASFFMLMGILMSLGNMIAVGLVTTEQTPLYANEARFAIKLPFLAAVYGVIVWHLALGVLMFYMVGFYFGIYFAVTCSLTLMFVLCCYAHVISTIDEAWRTFPSNGRLDEDDSTMHTQPNRARGIQKAKNDRSCCVFPMQRFTNGRDNCSLKSFGI
jgi:hypothetical protein